MSIINKEKKYIFNFENIIYIIKILKIAPIITVIIGLLIIGNLLNINIYLIIICYVAIYLLNYLLNNKYRRILILFYILLLILMGFFINITNIYSINSVIIVFILSIFNFIFIDNLLDIKNNSLNLKFNNKNYDLDLLFSILYVISYLNPFLYIFVGLIQIILILFNKFHWKVALIILVLLIILLYGVLSIYYPIIKDSTLFQIITITGFTLTYMFLIYSSKKLIKKIIK